MDSPSESYRLFPRLFHTDPFSFKTSASALIEGDVYRDPPNLLGGSLSLFVYLYHTDHPPCRRFRQSDGDHKLKPGSFQRVP